MNVDVSIIIPMYNSSDCIERSVRSVMAQSYSGPMECIIVDDCSTDNSVALCEALIASYKGTIEFRILCHEQNRGVSCSRNDGTRASVGRWIFYLDSDDELTPDCIDQMMAEVRMHPEIDLVHGNTASNIAKRARFYDLSFAKNDPLISDEERIQELFYSLKHPHLPAVCWNKLLKRELIFDHNLFFHEGIIHEDQIWLYHLEKYVSCIRILQDITYVHYYREGSLMDSQQEENDVHDYSCVVLDWIDHIDDCACAMQVKKILFFYNKYLVRRGEGLDARFRWRLVRELLMAKLWKPCWYFALWTLLYPIVNRRKYMRLALQHLYD